MAATQGQVRSSGTIYCSGWNGSWLDYCSDFNPMKSVGSLLLQSFCSYISLFGLDFLVRVFFFSGVDYCQVRYKRSWYSQSAIYVQRPPGLGMYNLAFFYSTVTVQCYNPKPRCIYIYIFFSGKRSSLGLTVVGLEHLYICIFCMPVLTLSCL